MKLPEVESRMMTDEQCGRILRLSDELGESDGGLAYIKGVVFQYDAANYISKLERRIADKPETHCECGNDIDRTMPGAIEYGMCATCLGDMR
jgi:hypothetical protein